MNSRALLDRPQMALIAHALILIAVMFVAVPAITTAFGGRGGYFLIMLLYWLGFCIPVFLLHVRKRHDQRLFSERVAWRDWWLLPLLLFQVVLIAAVAVAPNTSVLSTDAVFLAAAIGIINGPLEEIAWRGGFLARFADRRRLGFWLNWILFTAWHIPLTLANGIVVDGGGLALVGGAGVLGLFWSAIAFRTGSVFWVAMAHAMTNALTFSVLFAVNDFI